MVWAVIRQVGGLFTFMNAIFLIDLLSKFADLFSRREQRPTSMADGEKPAALVGKEEGSDVRTGSGGGT